MQNQSFQKHHVVAIPRLLKAGFDPMQMAVGQIGIFAADTNSAIVAPTSEKAIYIGYRLPAMRDAAMARSVATPYYSQGIKAGNVVGWRGYRGHRGRTEIVAIGFDGVDTTKTLSASLNDTKDLYVLLSGSPITKTISGQGLMLRYNVYTGCADCVTPPCTATTVQLEAIADELVAKINKDKSHFGFIEASKIVGGCTPNWTTVGYNQYQLVVSDAGDDHSLGLVQSLYGTAVTRVSRNGVVSTYETYATSLPSAYSTGNVVVIPECSTCPTGYELRTGYVYTYNREDTGDTTALNAVKALWGITETSESIIRVSYTLGVSKYLIVSNQQQNVSLSASANEVQTMTALGASAGNFKLTFGGLSTANIAFNANASAINTALTTAGITDVTAATTTNASATAVTFTYSGIYVGINVPMMQVNLTGLTGATGGVITETTPANLDLDFLSGYISYKYEGLSQNACVLTTATSIAWTAPGGTAVQYQRDHYLTLGDTICGQDRLAELQAAYAGVGTVSVNTAADCATKYKLRIVSNIVPVTCHPDEAVFPTLAPFNGNSWGTGTLVGTAGTSCKVGVIIKAAVFNPYTTECTFGNFTDDFDGIYMRVSEYDNDYNSEPELCKVTWPITKLQSFAMPSNLGAQVRQLEESTYLDVLRGYSYDAGVRLAEGFKFMAEGDQVYDTYTLEYRVSYPVGGFSQFYTDTYHEHFYFVQGTGKEFENAMNAWIGVVNPSLAPVVL
jgi:hypothetical protein